MNAETKETLEHLPYALEHVAGGIWACALLTSHTGETHLVAGDGSRLVGFASVAPFTNPLVEIGLVYCRKLLEFVGVKVRDGKNGAPDDLVAVSGRRRDDAGIERIEIPGKSKLGTVPVADLLGRAVEANLARDHTAAKEAIIHSLQAANKGVAHFVNVDKYKAEVPKMVLCSRITLDAVEHFVVKPLDMKLDDKYRPWSTTAL